MSDIPFLRLDRQFDDLKDEVIPEITKVLKSGNVLQGPNSLNLENRISKLFKKKHCVLVNSGTDALSFSLSSLNLKAGSRIAVTSMSFIASASVILQNNFLPVFVDICPDTMLMDNSKLLKLIKERKIDAIISVHLYGQIHPLESLSDIIKKYKIPIIEDAAQALGAKRFDCNPGQFGEVTCLSFDPTKVIGAYGSGGAIVTDSNEIAKHIKMLRYHGNYDGINKITGFNSQMAEIQAVIINKKLDYLNKWQDKRSKIADIFINELKSEKDISFFKVLEGNIHNYHKFVIKCEQRDELAKYLYQNGIQTKIHYKTPLHKHNQFNSYLNDSIKLTKVEELSEKIISLPIYPELEEKEIVKIVKKIKSFYS